MEEVRGEIVEDRVEVAKRNIKESIENYDLASRESDERRRETLRQDCLVDFIIVLYSLSVYEFYENWTFVFNRFVEKLPEFTFFEAIINRLNEAFRFFSSRVSPRTRNRVLRATRMKVLQKMVNSILANIRVKVKVEEDGSHDRTCNDNRQKVGNMCLKLILNQYMFRMRSIKLEITGSGMYLFKKMMISCFQNADVNPIFECILENHPKLLKEYWSIKNTSLKRVFFPKIATLGEDIEISEVYEISGVSALIYLDQHVPNRSSVSVTELLLKDKLVDRNTRDPHGFHVIFGPLFRTFNRYLVCMQRGQWRDREDDNEGGLFLYGIYPFLNACTIGVVDEIILRDKLRLFMQYQIECFFIVNEKPSDPESKYFVLYNDTPEEETVDESRMTKYLAIHQISMYELIRKMEKRYFDDFFDQPDPDLSLLEEYVLWMWDEKKRASLRMWRLFRTIRTHLSYDRMLCHPNFPIFRQVWRIGNHPLTTEIDSEGHLVVLNQRMREAKTWIKHRDRPSFVNEVEYYEEHYGDLSISERKEKALSVLKAFFQMIFMNASLVDYRTDAVSIYRPWHPVGTEEDGGVIHDMEEDGGVIHDTDSDSS